MREYFNKHKILLFNIFSLILTCLVFIPLFKKGIYRGADLQYHLSRLDGIIEAIKDGQFPIAIYPSKNFNYGYPSPLFYCDLFLIIPALIRYYLNIPLVTMYKVIIFVCIYITIFTTIYFTYDINSNIKASLLASILFIFSNYYLTDMYVRMALGEIMALAFTPFVLWNIYNFIFKDKDNSILLGIGFMCLLCSHNITFFLYVVLFGILLIINIKKIFNKKKLFILFKACVIGFCLSAFFLLPMFEQFMTNNLMVNNVSNYSLIDTALSIKQLFTDIFIQFNNEGITTIDNDKTIGLLILVLPLYGFISFKKNNKYTNELLIIAYIFILLSTKYIPLYKIAILESIQFTSRLYLLAIPLLAYVVSDTYSNIKYKEVIILLVLAYSLFNSSYLFKEVTNKNNVVIIDESSTAKELFKDRKYAIHETEYIQWNLEEVENGEYLVYHPNFNYYKHQDIVTDLYDSRVNVYYLKEGSKGIVKTNFIKDTTLVLPITNYVGYKGYEIDNNGNIIKEIEIGTERLTSRISIPVEEGNRTYLVIYNGTKIQKLSTIFSVSSASLLIIYLVIKKRKSLSKS